MKESYNNETDYNRLIVTIRLPKVRSRNSSDGNWSAEKINGCRVLAWDCP